MTVTENCEDFMPDADYCDDDETEILSPPKYTASNWLRLLGQISDLNAKDADRLFDRIRVMLDDLNDVPFR